MNDLNQSTRPAIEGRALREYLIDNGMLRPASRGHDDLTPRTRHAGRVVTLDDTGKRIAAVRVALGLSGKKDRSFDRDYEGNL